MRILVIDNYDSFTYNLVQMLAGEGVAVDVVRNDAEAVDDLLGRRPEGIVLSPGPGRPEGAGVCLELLRRCPEVPVLGVCLGHQALAAAFGARIGSASTLMHGKTSRVLHDGSGPFAGLPNPFEATRYHSLVVEEDTLPGELVPNAWSEGEGVLMGMYHRELPWWGVQFHPESILTEVGPALVRNFLRLTGDAAASEGEGS